MAVVGNMFLTTAFYVTIKYLILLTMHLICNNIFNIKRGVH